MNTKNMTPSQRAAAWFNAGKALTAPAVVPVLDTAWDDLTVVDSFAAISMADLQAFGVVPRAPLAKGAV